MRARACVLAVAVALLASGCGGHHHAAQLGFSDCVKAWNSTANNARAGVTPALVPGGFTGAGVQLSDTLGSGQTRNSPSNPVGCRVLLFNRTRWVAFLADRKGNEFRFRSGVRQEGAWPARGFRGPDNARLLPGARLEIPLFALVLSDLFDNGRIDGQYSCAAARAAVAHLPVGGVAMNTSAAQVRAYEHKVC
jgi:hypothetical protein